MVQETVHFAGALEVGMMDSVVDGEEVNMNGMVGDGLESSCIKQIGM